MADNPVSIQIGKEVLVLHKQLSSIPSLSKSIPAVKPTQTTITFSGSSIPSLSLTMPPPPPLPPVKKKSPAKKRVSKGPSTPKEITNCNLPQARIRTIMKTAPNVSFLSQESVAIATKAAEMFIKKLVMETRSMQQEQSSEVDIDYMSLVQVIRASKKLQFLKEFLPPKISVKEYLKQTVIPLPEKPLTTDISRTEKPLNTDISRTLADKSNTNTTINL